MTIGKTSLWIALAVALVSSCGQANAQERRVLVRVTCEGDNASVCSKAVSEATEVVRTELTRIRHFVFDKANMDPSKDLCGMLEVTISRYNAAPTWTATVNVYRYLKTCLAKPEPTGLPLIDLDSIVGKYPTEFNFPNHLGVAFHKYLTLNEAAIEHVLWNAIPLGFGAHLDNAPEGVEARVFVKLFKEPKENPQLFASATYTMRDLSAASGDLTFRLKGHDCTPQPDGLLVRARPRKVLEDPASGDARDFVATDSVKFRSMTENVVYMFSPGDIAECGQGGIHPSGFNSPTSARGGTPPAR